MRRIRTIALVHETLSREPGDDVAFLEIVRPLLRLAEEGLQSADRPMRFTVQGDGGRLPSTIATPLSVVLTELLQNAVDHGFPEGSGGGNVVVHLTQRGRELHITVVNDGRGLDPSFELNKATGLGLSIVRTLVTTELDGTHHDACRASRRTSSSSASATQPKGAGTVVDLTVPVYRHLAADRHAARRRRTLGGGRKGTPMSAVTEQASTTHVGQRVVGLRGHRHRGRGVRDLPAHRLHELGVRATVLEAGSDVGGTWYWNRYPGARFDSESISYGYSFSHELLQEWDWKERFSGQPENLRYLNYVADKFDLRPHMQFNCTVESCRLRRRRHLLAVHLDDGRDLTCRFVITAVGLLSAPTLPRYEGMDTFQGRSFHTYDWPEEPRRPDR